MTINTDYNINDKFFHIENSRIIERKVNRISPLTKCLDCKYQFEAESIYELCPKCDGINTELVQGKEMKVRSLELVFNK